MRAVKNSILAALLCCVVPLPAAAEGYRTLITDGDREIPVAVVTGSPYQMGLAFGRLRLEPHPHTLTVEPGPLGTGRVRLHPQPKQPRARGFLL